MNIQGGGCRVEDAELGVYEVGFQGKSPRKHFGTRDFCVIGDDPYLIANAMTLLKSIVDKCVRF